MLAVSHPAPLSVPQLCLQQPTSLFSWKPWPPELLVPHRHHQRNKTHMKDGLSAYRVYGLSQTIREVISLPDTVTMIICEHDNKNKYG